MKTTVEMQWNIYLECCRHICSGQNVTNVEYMYASVSGHIIDCIESI